MNDLAQRLQEHAELIERHEHQDSQHRQWAADLREASAAISRISLHAESSRVYARLAAAVRAGAKDSDLAELLRSEVAKRGNGGTDAPL